MSDSPSSSTPASTSAPVAVSADTATSASTSVADAGNLIAQDTSPQEAKAPTQQEIKEAVKKWKLKSNGKVREVSNEAELLRLAQLGLGAHEKFEQAATTRKKAEAILEVLQKDPAKALSSMGMDVRKLAEDYLMNEAKKQMMTPEERQKVEIQQEIERLKQEKEELQNQQREERITQLQAKYETDIQDQIIGAMEQYKLPKNPRTVARIAEYMASALENGYEASPLDVATRVKQDLEEEYKSNISNYSVEDLLRFLGEQKLKEIRQYEINKVKAKTPIVPSKPESIAVKPTEEDKPKKKMSMDDFQNELNKYLK